VTEARDTPGLDELTAALGDRRARSLAMGGAERIAQQHARHKLTARERIDLLFDPGTFVEFGLLAHQHSMTGAVTEPDRTPADGVVTGEGLVDGRRLYCAAYDFTVMAGSMGMIGEQKVARLRRKSMRRERGSRRRRGARSRGVARSSSSRCR
jgi:acetyl-CoA carboxylase carboxyltransferase component